MKIRLTRIQVLEYTPDSSFYPDGSTLDDMRKIDAGIAEDDPNMIFDDDSTAETITSEIID